MSLVYTISTDWITTKVVMYAFNSLAFTIHIYYPIGCHNYSFPLRFFKCNTIVQNAINSTNNCPASILLAF